MPIERYGPKAKADSPVLYLLIRPAIQPIISPINVAIIIDFTPRKKPAAAIRYASPYPIARSFVAKTRMNKGKPITTAPKTCDNIETPV